MNNKCINLKIKFDRTLYCKKKKKVINIKECSNCKYKGYVTKCHELKNLNKKTLKSRSNKLAKKEKGRYSIIYTDLTKCCKCGLKNGDYDNRINMYTKIEKNEVFEGSYRQVSIKLGMIAPLCIFCHKQFHKDILGMNLSFKVMFEKEYLKTHTIEEFIASFGQDYIFKLEQKKRS